MKLRGLAISLLAAAGLFSGAAQAEVQDKTATIKGVRVQYEVVLPNGYDPAKAYPTVLAFPPGGQDLQTVKATVDHVYKAQAETRGYIVVEPAAPGNALFFEPGGDTIFPDFITKIMTDYKVLGGKIHIAGMSNGGLSAFHIASKYPQYFWSVTGFPGFVDEASDAQLNALKGLCIAMYAGELDSGWPEEMAMQAKTLRAKGFPVFFAIEKGQPHVIETLRDAGAHRLFDQFEQARAGNCAKN
jgi:predicted peptidase